jgi:hypothetical protein
MGVVEMEGYFIIAGIASGIICGCFTSWLATQKGYGSAPWFFLGFFFSIFALATIIGAPDILSKTILREISGSLRGESAGGIGSSPLGSVVRGRETKKCKRCGKLIDADYKSCPHCGSSTFD